MENNMQSEQLSSSSQQYLETAEQFLKNSIDLNKLQIETLNMMNQATIVHYDKNYQKILSIKDEVQKTEQQYQKILDQFTKVDQIGMAIEGMESSVEYLSVILQRIETKMQDLNKMG